MMNALEDILSRPDQLVRLLGACLGVNLVTVLQGLAFLGEPFSSVFPITVALRITCHSAWHRTPVVGTLTWLILAVP